MENTDNRFTSEELQLCLNSVQGSIFQYQKVVDATQYGDMSHLIAKGEVKKLVDVRDKLVTHIMNGKAVKNG